MRPADKDGPAQIEGRDHPGGAAQGGRYLQHYQVQPPHPHPGRSVRYPDGVHVKETEENAVTEDEESKEEEKEDVESSEEENKEEKKDEGGQE